MNIKALGAITSLAALVIVTSTGCAQQTDRFAKWASLESNINLEGVFCPGYGQVGHVIVHNDNNEDVVLDIQVEYEHADGSVAGTTYSTRVRIAAKSEATAYFNEPANMYSFDRCQAVSVTPSAGYW